MGFKLVAFLFLVLGIASVIALTLHVYWAIYTAGFCFFVSVLLFLVSVMARRGASVWRERGPK